MANIPVVNADDRVCVYYMIDRLEEALNVYDFEDGELTGPYLHHHINELKKELVYNLGVNRRNEHG